MSSRSLPRCLLMAEAIPLICELGTLSAPVGAEVLRLAPCVNRPWAFPLGAPSPPWWRHWDLLLALRRQRFDAAFNFSGADRTLFVTRLAGARWRGVAY